jgi:hypothetical protein
MGRSSRIRIAEATLTHCLGNGNFPRRFEQKFLLGFMMHTVRYSHIFRLLSYYSYTMFLYI